MLHILNNQINSLDVTVSNESELNNPNFLWVLTNLETRDKIYFLPYLDDVTHAGRFDTFIFSTYPLDPIVLTGSTCNIHIQQGQHSYTIYDQVSSTNLDPLLSNSVVETGLAWMEANELCFSEYEDEKKNAEATVYKLDDELCYVSYLTDNEDAQAVVYYNPDLVCYSLKWNDANVQWQYADFNWENSNPVVN
ncbi:hypothetical protein UFOVP1479_37 [uncultured Caudovirales phage]|uniref:Uncharacterized protein n=3 Tax=uncultured Caudovirales phage TaxID=2100421 RepID=A0A6J7XQ83_9CAUD|nr:hypothetical protein UFOVP310_39 [uncultured Caudovirales phage]CAB4152416.1 hypothetical protein UFOVP619_17 [uncultured Caudovirales phage]CAB4184469.1 hypothetical protein UFOVP1114_10 [uncultured Caudovirales phage]CAB4203970.1 hypothetical protein UFOVP1386_10 [uncultured Caudovirales phage]CAB4215574.1 hypothetical protein UFOVP1479_37 [uncultured Caudovirales phage]